MTRRCFLVQRGFLSPFSFSLLLLFLPSTPDHVRNITELVPSFHTCDGIGSPGEAPTSSPALSSYAPHQPHAWPWYLLFAVLSTSAIAVVTGFTISPARGMMEEDTSSLFISLQLMVEVIHFCYNKILQKKKQQRKILMVAGREIQAGQQAKKAALSCLASPGTANFIRVMWFGRLRPAIAGFTIAQHAALALCLPAASALPHQELAGDGGGFCHMLAHKRSSCTVSHY